MKSPKNITLRDYFAAKALEGWLAQWPAHPHPACNQQDADAVAALSYKLADSMLIARDKNV